MAVKILFIVMFFLVTVMVGVMWEIIEFASDSWFSTNMQRAYVSTTNGRGAALIGQEALLDTIIHHTMEMKVSSQDQHRIQKINPISFI